MKKNYTVIGIAAAAVLFFSAALVMSQKAPFSENFESGLIFEPRTAGFDSCHGSTVVELPNGDIMAAWYGGDNERATNVAIYASIRKKGGKTWAKPWIIQDAPDKSEGNPVLWMGPDGKIWFFYVTIQKVTWNEAFIYFRKSGDGGKTWSEPAQMTKKMGWMTRNKLLRLANGDILLPIYNEMLFDSEFLISSDGGGTWAWSSIIRSPGTNLQPTVVQLSDGSLLAGMRTGSKNGLMWWSRSKSNGHKWSKPYNNEIKNPHSACDMSMLANGHIALVYNDSGTARNPLTVAISTDEGATWPHKRNLEYDLANAGSFAYPAIIQSSDGLIHVTYSYNRDSIKHAAFSEEWALEKQ